MFEFAISREQVKEFASACAEQIIKEIAANEKQEKELLNCTIQQESHEKVA